MRMGFAVGCGGVGIVFGGAEVGVMCGWTGWRGVFGRVSVRRMQEHVRQEGRCVRVLVDMFGT